jgi:hypothetical protein
VAAAAAGEQQHQPSQPGLGLKAERVEAWEQLVADGRAGARERGIDVDD